MNSQPEWATFSWWTYSFCERSTRRGTGIRDSHWDVVQYWDLREVGEMPWWVHMWIQFSSLGVRKCPYILNQLSDPEFFRKCAEIKRKLGDTVLCDAKAYKLNTLLGYKTEEVYIKWILHKTDIFLLGSSYNFLAAATAAAKSLQSCPTLCDPIVGSPPGFSVPGILQARTLEWVAISFSNAWKWKVKVKYCWELPWLLRALAASASV